MVAPLPTYPEKRLIVFAALASEQARLDALCARRVEAVMGSFELMKSGSWWAERGRSLLDRWPQYRYLDSGAFTLLRKSSGSRIKRGSQPSASSSLEVVDYLEYQDYKAHLAEYIAFLARHLDAFDFVFELDMDLLKIRSGKKVVPGIEVTYAGRKILRRVAGDKLIPVWHSAVPDPGHGRFKEMCSEYKYIAIGSSLDPTDRKIKYLCDYAHTQGVLVHGLGTSRVDVLEATPFDTVDSTTWLSAVRFGQFAGTMFPLSAPVSSRQQSKVPGFRATVRDLGYDPDHLLASGGEYVTEKYEVAIALMQRRQDAAPPIPRPLASASLFE